MSNYHQNDAKPLINKFIKIIYNNGVLDSFLIHCTRYD